MSLSTVYHPDLSFVSYMLGSPASSASPPPSFPYASVKSTTSVVHVDPICAVAAGSLTLTGPISLVRLSATCKTMPDPNLFKRRLCPASELSMTVPADKLRPLGDPLSAVLWSSTARYTSDRVGVKGVSLVNGVLGPTLVRKNGTEYCSASLVLVTLESDGTVTHSYRWTARDGNDTVLELSAVQLSVLTRIRERHPFAWLDPWQQFPLLQKDTYDRLIGKTDPIFWLVYGWQEDETDRLTMEAYHAVVTGPHLFPGQNFFVLAHSYLSGDHELLRRLVTKWCNCQSSMQYLHDPPSLPHLWRVLLAFMTPGIKIDTFRKLYWNPFVATAARALSPDTKPLEWLSALLSAPGAHDELVRSLAHVGKKRPAFLASLLLSELPSFDPGAPIMLLADHFVKAPDRRLLLDRLLGKSRALRDVESDRTVANLWAEIKRWHTVRNGASSSSSSSAQDCNDLLSLLQRTRGELGSSEPQQPQRPKKKTTSKATAQVHLMAIRLKTKKTVSPARDRRVTLMTSIPGERKVASNGPILTKPIKPIHNTEPDSKKRARQHFDRLKNEPPALVLTYSSPDFVKRPLSQKKPKLSHPIRQAVIEEIDIEPYDPTRPQITAPKTDPVPPLDPGQLDRLYTKLVGIQQIPDPGQQAACLQHYAYGLPSGHLQWQS